MSSLYPAIGLKRQKRTDHLRNAYQLLPRHKHEVEEDNTVAVKRIDLYIWQAILVRRLSGHSHQVVKGSIHDRYNDFIAASVFVRHSLVVSD